MIVLEHPPRTSPSEDSVRMTDLFRAVEESVEWKLTCREKSSSGAPQQE